MKFKFKTQTKKPMSIIYIHTYYVYLGQSWLRFKIRVISCYIFIFCFIKQLSFHFEIMKPVHKLIWNVVSKWNIKWNSNRLELGMFIIEIVETCRACIKCLCVIFSWQLTIHPRKIWSFQVKKSFCVLGGAVHRWLHTFSGRGSSSKYVSSDI